ncbi:MAG TPA: FAD:protein FMN transferase [Chitinophagaceae bacterium]|nr:FAD:protein FMN transferase [Chitinophagaceae bacterium]
MKRSIELFLLAIFFISCKDKQEDSLIKITGEAQGTTYSIAYLSSDGINYKKSVDSLLRVIDTSLSTWVSSSIISRINNNDSTAQPDEHFIKVFNKAIEVSELTSGDFDITVGPIINAWGFGFSKKEKIDSLLVDSLLKNIGYKMVRLENNKLIKEKESIQLDFNAIAQGYSVDVLGALLEAEGITDYFIELGGEVIAKGHKQQGEKWKIGIDSPDENNLDERKIKAILQLENKALATSGNYRKFYIENGKKYSHIIDPHTGYPAKHHLLSASVIAADCMIADAFATAFMVMGTEKSKEFLANHEELGLEVYFIYDEGGKWKTYVSEGIKKQITELN